MLTRSPAFGLSFEIVSVAVAKVLPGFAVVAVNVAVVEPVDVTPIRTRAESAIVARRRFVPRISGSPFSSGSIRRYLLMGELSRRAVLSKSDRRGELP